MKSPHLFLIKPVGQEYNNSIEIAGQTIIINSTVENAKHVNRFAEVISVPIRYNGDIKAGDIIIVHHNVFRIYYDTKGRPKKSPNFFRDDVYMIDPFQFYMYHNGVEWQSVEDWCFVRPIDKENPYLYEKALEENTGELVYGNKRLTSRGVDSGSLIKFSKNSEYEFLVNDEVLYRMNTRDVIALI